MHTIDAVLGLTSEHIAYGSALYTMLSDGLIIAYLYFSPSSILGTKIDHIPFLDTFLSLKLSSISNLLESHTNHISLAFGAHTVNFTPFTPFSVTKCEPNIC